MGREGPPNLPYLELGRWIVSHPPKSYYRDQSVPIVGPVMAVVDVVAHGVEKLHPLGWALFPFEILHAQMELEEREELPARRLEAQREGFRQLMWDQFWTNESRYDSAGEVSDRWLPKVENLYDLQQRLQTLEKEKPPLSKANEELIRKGDIGGFFGTTDPAAHERANYVGWEAETRETRKAFESSQAAMAADVAKDVQSVKDFESNPANWSLTPEQQAILTSKAQP
jgi:hypothetical protein